VGGVAARLFSPMAEKMMKDDIRSLKHVMENGGAPKGNKKKNKRTQVVG
jgi:hypothetical protein